MIIWFSILGAWTVSFFFAGIESGLLSVDPVRLRHHVKRRTAGAIRLNRLLKKPERLLLTVLLVTNLANILGLLLLTQVLVVSFGRAGFVIAIAIALPIYLFVLSVLPKSLFRRFPFRALAALGGLIEGASVVLWPFVEIGGRIGALFLPQRVTDRARLFAAREDLKQIAVQSEREGSLTSTERAMIHNVVDFRNVKMRDVMLPLNKSVTIQPGTSIDELLRISKETGVDRLPVVSSDRQAIGLVNVLDILLDKDRAKTLSKYTRRLVTADANEPAYRSIQRLRAARVSLAAIVDADKKLIGTASSESMIKRLVQSA